MIEAYVKDDLFPSNCPLKDYAGLSQLVCLPCHPQQPDYTDTENKVVRVCDSLLLDFYSQRGWEWFDREEKEFDYFYPERNLDNPTVGFEECGAWNEPDPIVKANDGCDPTKGYELDEPDPELIYPFNAFKNAKEFFDPNDGFHQAQIPFMENFRIMMIKDKDENGNDIPGVVCYKNAIALANMLPVVLAATAINFLV